MTLPTSPNGPRETARGAHRTTKEARGVVLFPGCDPRGVLMRALAADAPPWETRPDALIFAWMVALPTGASAAAAARAIRLVLQAGEPRTWTSPQEDLLAMLAKVEQGKH